MSDRSRAIALISENKGDTYEFGAGALAQTGRLAAQLGRRALLVRHASAWMRPHAEAVTRALGDHGVRIVAEADGARPNTPLEDVYRLQATIESARPDVIVTLGAGSTIDAVKAANALATCAPGVRNVEPLFGTGKVTELCARTGAAPIPTVAVMCAASSAAHLTKYANVTDVARAQKKLIIDDALTPARAVFDYDVTRTMSPEFIRDGALDGVAHLLEVYYGARPDTIDRLEAIARVGLALIVGNLERRLADPGGDAAAREAIGLGTDLGGCAIMIGGTNGAHLNSFSFVDILPHGRACALMNPYYTVFFAPAIERQLRVVGAVYRAAGHLDANLDRLGGRELGVAVAQGMLNLSRAIGFPTRLREVAGFGETHIARALAAAKNPQLASKLQQMPQPMRPDDVDRAMGSVLRAASAGDFAQIEDL